MSSSCCWVVEDSGLSVDAVEAVVVEGAVVVVAGTGVFSFVGVGALSSSSSESSEPHVRSSSVVWVAPVILLALMRN